MSNSSYHRNLARKHYAESPRNYRQTSHIIETSVIYGVYNIKNGECRTPHIIGTKVSYKARNSQKNRVEPLISSELGVPEFYWNNGKIIVELLLPSELILRLQNMMISILSRTPHIIRTMMKYIGAKIPIEL